MERGVDVVPGQQRRLAFGRFGHVQVERHHRLGAHQFGLVDVGAHPGAAALGGTRERIDQDQRQLGAVGVEGLVDLDVLVVHRQVGALLEGHAVQFGHRVEDALLEHVVQFQVRLQLVLVEIVLGLAHLLGVVGPVPGLQRESRLLLGLLLPVDHGLQHGAFLAGVGDRGRRQLGQHGVDRFRVLGGLFGQAERGVAGIAHDRGALGAQFGHARDDGAVVERVAAAAAGDRGLVQALAQGAVVQLRQQRLAGGVEQGDAVFARHAFLFGALGQHGDLFVAQAGQLGAVGDDHRRVVHFRQHVLAELGGQRRHFGVDCLDPCLLRVAQVGAGAHEIGVVALDQAHALLVQTQVGALFIQRLDAREQLGVQVDAVAVGGELGRVLGVQFVEGVVGVGAGQVAERDRGAGQQLAGAFHRQDGVVEGRRLAVIGDGLDLAGVFGHAAVEGRREIAVLDLVELRVLVRQGALLEEGIHGVLGVVGGRLGRSGGGAQAGGGQGKRDGQGDGVFQHGVRPRVGNSPILRQRPLRKCAESHALPGRRPLGFARIAPIIPA